jgi:hypothetical protein
MTYFILVYLGQGKMLWCNKSQELCVVNLRSKEIFLNIS